VPGGVMPESPALERGSDEMLYDAARSAPSIAFVRRLIELNEASEVALPVRLLEPRSWAPVVGGR